MKLALVIAIHDFKRLFSSPLPWLILACVQFLLGIFFYLLLSRYIESTALYASRGITEVVIVGVLQIAGVLMLLISPFVTMRFFSDELRSGTIKLLLSSPASVTSIVLGKYLAVMSYYCLIAVAIALMPASLAAGTSLDSGLLFSGFLGLLMLFSVFACIGLFFSSLNHSPPMAAISSFLFSFLLWISHITSDTENPHVEALANYVSLQKHFNAMLSGAFNTSDLAFFFLSSLLFLALCIWRLDRVRTHQ